MAEALGLALANQRLRDALLEKALFDPLTGLRNRHHLEDTLHTQMTQAIRNGEPLSCMMIDIDHFKSINDRFGHEAGDQVIKSVATIVQRATHDNGMAFRYGGEEFAVVLDEVSPEHALHVAERLRQTVEQLGIPHPGSPAGHVTISLGVAAVEVLTPETLPRLLETADSALYSAKEHGRNRVHLAGELVKKSACLAAGDRL